MGSMAGWITRWRNMWTSARLNWDTVRCQLSAAGTSMGRLRFPIPGCSVSAAGWASGFRNWSRLLRFGVRDVDDGDLRGGALGGDRNHDVVSVFFAGGENGSVAGLDDRGLIAELFLVEGNDFVGGVWAEGDGGD